jgi:hypothetical protein
MPERGNDQKLGHAWWAQTVDPPYKTGDQIMFGRATNELEKPPISREKGSFEILRVWGGNDLPQQYTLNTTWEDPGAWGIMLVDIARHAAKAYGNAGNITEQETLERIKQLFDAEWGKPTDAPQHIK